jgi:anti-sigma factor ChrR (cupin superfamily)
MEDSGWLPLRPGIERRPLAKDTARGIQADLIRIEPNLTDRPHTHDGFEWVYLLEGGFTDQSGTHKAGDFLINTTEGVHQLTSGPDGCTLFIVWTGSVTEVVKKN